MFLDDLSESDPQRERMQHLRALGLQFNRYATDQQIEAAFFRLTSKLDLTDPAQPQVRARCFGREPQRLARHKKHHNQPSHNPSYQVRLFVIHQMKNHSAELAEW